MGDNFDNELELEPDKMKSLRVIIDSLDLDYEEVFSDSFMAEHTDFSSIDEMFEEGDFYNSRGSIDHQITVGDADDLADKHSAYPTWHQLMDQALDEYWKSPHENRRRHERHECDIDVSVEAGMSTFDGRLVDISKKGFQVETQREIPNTRTVKVELPQQESAFNSDMIFRGAMRWTNDEPPYAMGVEILSKEKR